MRLARAGGRGPREGRRGDCRQRQREPGLRVTPTPGSAENQTGRFPPRLSLEHSTAAE